ncbi:amidase [Sphingobium naphthae]|nr:amidase [Sphingobium naphthae]
MTITDKVERQIDRINSLNPVLKAVITSVGDQAVREARAADERQAQHGGQDRLKLDGVTVTVKDNIDVAGICRTNGSPLFGDEIPDRDATVVARLRAAGAIILGKANQHELAFASTSQNQFYGACRNPWDINRIPGGSSGGSGAALAAGMCDVSIATDGGGSIRGPSALNGVVGLRPTIGRISNQGSIHFCPTFDTIGPMARTVRAVADVYDVIAGYDPLDETSCNVPVKSWSHHRALGPEGLTLGVPRNFFFEDIAPEIEAAVRKSIEIFSGLGLNIVEVDLPTAEFVQRDAGPILLCDAAAYYENAMLSDRDKFGQSVYDRLMLGYKVTGVEYSNAVRAKILWQHRVDSVFQQVDFLITPTVDRVAPSIAEAEDVIAVTRSLTRLLVPWSIAQHPALAVPCGFTQAGLPIGMQLIGRRFDEARLLMLGDAYQSVTNHHEVEPQGLEVLGIEGLMQTV